MTNENLVTVIDKIFTDYWNDHDIPNNEMVHLSDLQNYFTNWIDEFEKPVIVSNSGEVYDGCPHCGYPPEP